MRKSYHENMQRLLFCCSNNDNNKILHFCSKTALYWIFATLRILLVFFPQTGYIHPDEYFQFIEIGAGDSFDIDVYKPWEFNISFPIRSSLFPQLCVKIPYLILGGLNPYCESFLGFSLKNPYFLILFPRLMMTILSFISDYCLYKICLTLHQPYINRLTVFSSSYIMLIYSTRTFSNSIEMILVSILLYHVSRCMEFSNKIVLQSDYLADKYYKAKSGVERTRIYKLRMSLPPHSLKDCLLVATITVFGIFNRPTFIAYALTPIFFWFHRGLGSKSIGFLDFHTRIFMFICFGIPTVISLILFDSLYFGYLTMAEIGNFEISINNFVITPFNFLRYNSITDNLKNHGIHSRFLHIIVNIPLLFNVLGVIGIITFTRMLNSGLRGRWLELPRIQSIESLMVTSFVIPITILSIFPHQEPRFIIPVLLPLVFLFAHWIKISSDIRIVNIIQEKKINHKSKKDKIIGLKYIWYICNIILTLFYGFIHQGGVLPITFHLFNELKVKPHLTHIHYFSSHLYPLPTGLLHLRNTKKTYISNSGHKYILTKDFHMHELGSKNVHYVYNSIKMVINKCEEDLTIKRIPCRVYYALPFSFYNDFAEHISQDNTNSLKFTLIKSIFPHLSLEKLPFVDFSWNCFSLNTSKNCVFNFAEKFLNNVLNYLKQFTVVLLQIEYKK